MDYRDLINKEFQRRKELNPKYSLRQFARDLHLRPSHVSDLLKYKKGLSTKNADITARRLGYVGNSVRYFRFLVVAISGRARWEINSAKRALLDPHIAEAKDSERCRFLSPPVWKKSN